MTPGARPHRDQARELRDAVGDILAEGAVVCQRRALGGALAAGPQPGHVLFLNLEPGGTGFMPLELRALYGQATSHMTVAVEVTERAICEHPAALLGTSPTCVRSAARSPWAMWARSPVRWR